MARSISDTLHKLRISALRAMRSSKGKDVLLYLLFVCVAFVFWALLSLDSEQQRDFEVPVEIDEVPDSVTVIGSLPSSLNVAVQGKGYQFLKYNWGRMPVLKLKFADNEPDDHFFSLSRVKIDGRLRDYFGNGVLINSVKPDSIKLAYTTRPGVKLPLHVVADIHPNLQCIISGPIRASVDSVTVYSINDIPRSMTSVSTEAIIRTGLKDTTRYEVRINAIPGMRVIPDRVTVTVPVEPLIMKKRSIAIEAVNLPNDINLITFPSKIDVSYLVQMSAYSDDFPIKVYVDYNNVSPSGSRIPVSLSLVPEIYHNVTLATDSVEYIIERKAVPVR